MPAKLDPRVTAYIAAAAPFAQPILKHLRKLVHAACPGVEENIKWSSISFGCRGKILAGMASFKAHATFGFWHKDMAALLKKDGLATDEAMGLLGRITTVDDLPSDKTMTRYLKTAMALTDAGKPSRPARKVRPELPMPADLAAGLKRNARAAATWTGFSPSCRREYIEWIIEAKCPETREQRLETTLEWVAEGKQRHWKYQNC